jgi:hypothetical protein
MLIDDGVEECGALVAKLVDVVSDAGEVGFEDALRRDRPVFLQRKRQYALGIEFPGDEQIEQVEAIRAQRYGNGSIRALRALLHHLRDEVETRLARGHVDGPVRAEVIAVAIFPIEIEAPGEQAHDLGGIVRLDRQDQLAAQPRFFLRCIEGRRDAQRAGKFEHLVGAHTDQLRRAARADIEAEDLALLFEDDCARHPMHRSQRVDQNCADATEDLRIAFMEHTSQCRQYDGPVSVADNTDRRPGHKPLRQIGMDAAPRGRSCNPEKCDVMLRLAAGQNGGNAIFFVVGPTERHRHGGWGITDLPVIHTIPHRVPRREQEDIAGVLADHERVAIARRLAFRNGHFQPRQVLRETPAGLLEPGHLSVLSGCGRQQQQTDEAGQRGDRTASDRSRIGFRDHALAPLIDFPQRKPT